MLIGAGLMIRSFQQFQSVAPGFETHGVLTMTAAVSRARDSLCCTADQFFEQVLQRVRTFPGVESAGVVDDIPLDNGMVRISQSPLRDSRQWRWPISRRWMCA